MNRPLLSDLEEIARLAGDILREEYGHRNQIERKGVINLVSDVDRRSEEVIINTIRSRFPDHRIIAEESGGLEGLEDHSWYVDPLDGTVNYIHGVPVFSVSIAYAEEGNIVLGVVFDPMLEECFSAERGIGAWLNGELLNVSSTEDLDHSLLVTGFPYDIRDNPENNLGHFARLALKTRGVRRFGSAALDMCYVASGRFDGYWEIRLEPWDMAAGGLIVREAGGIVTDVQGDPDYLRPPYSIIAANPQIHPKIQEVLHMG